MASRVGRGQRLAAFGLTHRWAGRHPLRGRHRTCKACSSAMDASGLATGVPVAVVQSKGLKGLLGFGNSELVCTPSSLVDEPSCSSDSLAHITSTGSPVLYAILCCNAKLVRPGIRQTQQQGGFHSCRIFLTRKAVAFVPAIVSSPQARRAPEKRLTWPRTSSLTKLCVTSCPTVPSLIAAVGRGYKTQATR